MPNYDEGKIYMMYLPGLEEYCYIGSTTNELRDRYSCHKNSLHRKENKCTAHQLFLDGNEPVIKLIEDYPCSSREELLSREQYWISQYPDCINYYKKLVKSVSEPVEKKRFQFMDT
jgi:hypothetical protein